MARRVAVEKFLEGYEGWIVKKAAKVARAGCGLCDPEDVAQEFRLKVCEAGRSLDVDKAAAGYFYRAVSNRAKDLARGNWRNAALMPSEHGTIKKGEECSAPAGEHPLSDVVSRADWLSCLSDREYAVALVLSEGVVASEIVRAGCLTRGQVQYVIAKLRGKLGEAEI